MTFHANSPLYFDPGRKKASNHPAIQEAIYGHLGYAMKLLTLNFLTCARKSCKTSTAAFPLHPREAELEIVETEINPKFLVNILPRVEWDALKTICQEVRPSFVTSRTSKPYIRIPSSVSPPYQTRYLRKKTYSSRLLE